MKHMLVEYPDDFVPDFTMKFETVTPDKAKEYLANKLRNRKLKNAWIASLQLEIEAGQWKPSASAFHLYKNQIFDGQNRLTAISKSKTPVVCLMVNHFRNIVDKIDTGAIRTVGDQRIINGDDNGKSRSSTFSQLDYLINGKTPAKQTLLVQSKYDKNLSRRFDRLFKQATEKKYKGGFFLGTALFSYLSYPRATLDFVQKVSSNKNCEHGTLLFRMRKLMESVPTGWKQRIESGKKMVTAIRIYSEKGNIPTYRLYEDPQDYNKCLQNARSVVGIA